MNTHMHMHMHTLSPTRSTVLVRLAAIVLSNTHAKPVCFPIITYRYESLLFFFRQHLCFGRVCDSVRARM